MIALPPLLAGAVHVNATCAFPATPTRFVGAPGAPTGVRAALLVEYAPIPACFVAATRNTYAVPFVKPVTVTDGVAETVSLNVVQFEPLSLEY